MDVNHMHLTPFHTLKLYAITTMDGTTSVETNSPMKMQMLFAERMREHQQNLFQLYLIPISLPTSRYYRGNLDVLERRDHSVIAVLPHPNVHPTLLSNCSATHQVSICNDN